MKKTIGLILTVSIILSVFVLPPNAFGSAEFLVAESYNNQTTGVVPGNGALTSGLPRVLVTQENKNKGVELSASSVDSSVYYATNSTENVVSVYADLEYVNDWSYTEFFIRNSSNKNFVLAYIKEDGMLYMGDDRMTTVVPKDRTSSIQLTYNKKRKKLSVYLNGKAIDLNRFIGDGAFDEYTHIGIKVKGKLEAQCILDNFAVFAGYNVIESSDVPKAGFVSDSAEVDISVGSGAQSGAEAEFVGDTIFTNRTFDEEDLANEYEKITRSCKLNTIEIDKSVFDGNKYIKLEKKEAEESFIAFGASQTARYVIIEADFSTDNNTPAGKLLYTRDGEAASMFCTFLNVATNGNVTTTDGRIVTKIEPLKWVRISLALNMNDLCMDIYVDGEKKFSDIPLANKTLTGVPLIRINCDKKVNTGTLLVDNIRAYEGKTLRGEITSERATKRIPDSVPQGYIGVNKAICPYSSTYYTNKTKYDAENKMIIENEDSPPYVHEVELKKMFGDSVVLTAPHLTQAGYYNALETAKASGYQITSMDTRLHIFSRGGVELPEDRMMEVYRYMYNVRPTAEQLLELYENSENYQKHPRVLIDSEKLERIKSLYKTDANMKKWGDNVIAAADALMGENDYTYPVTGGSMDEVNYSMNDIVNLCLAYHLTGNERYVGRTWRFLKVICDLGNWNPGGYLDVGELSFITAIGYDWLYDKWTPEQRKYIEENLYEKGTKLTRDLYLGVYDNTTYMGNDGKITDFYVGWYDSENNWNPVCNGGTMCGAIALLDVYPQIASELIESANWALEYAIPSYYPEGAWEEGGGYWAYALGYVVRTIETFRNTFGTDFRISEAPGLDGTGWYGSRLAGSTGAYSIGDTSGGYTNNPHVMWCATEYQDATLMAMRMQEIEKFNLSTGYNEMLYYDPDLLKGEVTPPLDTFMEGMEIIALREAWYDAGATFVGASGGNNGRGHGHYDTGSFQIDMAGERFIRDSGAENYNAKGGYFTKNRYNFYKSRPEGHNMYIINPENDNLDYKGVVPGSRAEGKLVESKPRGSFATMDLTEVYGQWVSHAERGYMLTDDRRSVIIRDEIDLLEPDSEILYSLHTRAKIEKLNDTQILLTHEGKKMLISLLTNGADVVFEEAEAATVSNVTKTVVSDTNNASQGLRKAVIKMKGTGRLNITLKFKLYDDMMIADYPEDINIADWTIPDGEVTPLPVADAIYIDGELVEDFDPKITGYSYVVPSKATEIPTVTVDTPLKHEVIPAEDFGGDTIVKVYSADNPEVYRAYRLNLWKKPPLQDIDGMRRYPIAEVTCIESYELTSPPDNTFDMDFGTRWASQSTEIEPEQWIMFKLDDTYPIEKIGVSWMSGTARQYTYKLEISLDGENWTEVYNGVSSGTTIDCEYTQLGGKMAKYVRYKGYGNTINGWNSVTEIEILGNQR